MSKLTDNLSYMASKVLSNAPSDAGLLTAAAARIDQLERDTNNEVLDRQRDEIERLRAALSVAHTRLVDNSDIVSAIALAAGLEGTAGVNSIIGTVALATRHNAEALARQEELAVANATCRKAEKENGRLNQELSKAHDECENTRGQLLHRTALLHEIADKLGAGSRNMLPAKDWYLDRISGGNYSQLKKDYDYVVNACAGLENGKNQAEKMLLEIADKFNGIHSTCVNPTIPRLEWFMDKIDDIKHAAETSILASSAQHRAYLNNIGDAVGKPVMSYKDLTEHIRILDIKGLQRSQEKLTAVAVQLQNWEVNLGCHVMDDRKDPNWAKMVNVLLSVAARQLRDAEAKGETNATTLLQLAQVLGICTEPGWHTKMVEKATSLMSDDNTTCMAHYRHLRESTEQYERCKNRITAANVRWGIEAADPPDYVGQLDYLIDEIGVARIKASRLNDDLVRSQRETKVGQEALVVHASAIKNLQAIIAESTTRAAAVQIDLNKYTAFADLVAQHFTDHPDCGPIQVSEVFGTFVPRLVVDQVS